MGRKTPESKIKTDFIEFLKGQGCVVRINKQDATAVAGFPDITAYKEGWYGMFEIKEHKNSSKQPGQQRWIDKFDKWSYARFVYKENLAEVEKELKEILRD